MMIHFLNRAIIARKNLFLAASALLLCAACQHSEDSFPFVLTVQQTGNMERLLAWNEVPKAESYKIYRSVKKNGTFPDATLLTTVDLVTVEYRDQSVPLSDGLQYYVIATADKREFKSNAVTSVGATEFYMNPDLMKLLPDKNLAIVRDYSDIYVLDYEQRAIVKKRTFPGKVGGFDVGTYNGKTELYLPNANNVYIMNALDLTMIDTLTTSFPVQSVAVNSKGRIYLSCSQQFTPLKIFDRAKLDFIGQYAGESDSQLLLQSDNKLLAVSTHISPATMSFYTFDDQGKLITKTDDPYGYDYEMDADHVKMSSKYIVTSTKGFVYTADHQMTLVTKLTNLNPTAVDFEFSVDGNSIYLATTTTNAILKYTITGNTSSTTSISTQAFPWVMARNDNEMIVLGAPTSSLPSMRNGKTTLERVVLK